MFLLCHLRETGRPVVINQSEIVKFNATALNDNTTVIVMTDNSKLVVREHFEDLVDFLYAADISEFNKKETAQVEKE